MICLLHALFHEFMKNKFINFVHISTNENWEWVFLTKIREIVEIFRICELLQHKMFKTN